MIIRNKRNHPPNGSYPPHIYKYTTSYKKFPFIIKIFTFFNISTGNILLFENKLIFIYKENRKI